MIVNMHIRKDFQKWLLPKDSKGRVTAVCGKKTPVKYAGIPGVTKQDAFVSDKYSGWCVHCCGQALEKMNDALTNNKTQPFVHHVYVAAMDVCAKQIVMSNKGH
jgi:hypothetical protein